MKQMLVVLCALLIPAPAIAKSCVTYILVTNHRDRPVDLVLKSFDSEQALPAPELDDVDETHISARMPLRLSQRREVHVPGGGAQQVRFRTLCGGHFWLNWREVTTDRSTASSGQTPPSAERSIEIR